MLWVNKLKEGAREIIKEHPLSVCMFFVAFLFMGILTMDGHPLHYPWFFEKGLEFLQYFLLGLTPAVLLCESNYLYKKHIGKIQGLKEKNSVVYIVVLVIGAINSLIFTLLEVTNYSSKKMIMGMKIGDFDAAFFRFFVVYLAICVFSAVFFLYKRSGETFESYTVKGFLGCLKGYLAYGVVILGAMCIIWVFNTLIFELEIFGLVSCLISGAMAYTVALLALAKPGEKISKFGKIMMGYVFPGILAIAMVIVYVYILKILFTWTFPSNEAFAIVTALFGSGICFWTMAQGCTEGAVNKVLRVFPVAFIPCIVIQTMCLYMRVHQYGLTPDRYLGVLLIVFEILYEGYYIVRLSMGKGLGGVLFPVLILFVAVYFIVPGVNVYAAVTNSQKKVVNRVVAAMASGQTPESSEIAKGKSAYNAIRRNGGLEGDHYLKKLYAKYSEEEVNGYFGDSDIDYYHEYENIYANHDWEAIDVSGYTRMSAVEISSYEEEQDPHHLVLKSENGGKFSKEVDLSQLLTKMYDLQDQGARQETIEETISTPVDFGDGSCLYISYINVRQDSNGLIMDINVRGYLLY